MRKHAARDAACRPGFIYVELAGQNIRLRPTLASDAARAFSLITGETGFTRFMLWDGPASVSELARTYGKRWSAEMRQGVSYSFAIEEKGKPGIIGCIQLKPAKYERQYEFGYWLGKPYWNRGYTAEALGLLCFFGFHHLKADVIMGSAFTSNHASRRVMEKNGFLLDGTLRHQILKHGQWVDLWHLSLLREEWESRRTEPIFEKVLPLNPS